MGIFLYFPTPPNPLAPPGEGESKRTADLIESRRIRVYMCCCAVRGGTSQVSGVAVVVNGSGQVCQRWPLACKPEPSGKVGDGYDLWSQP